MFDDGFEHYLSYGSTDQRTVRAVRGGINGLLVPGTVAAFQKYGTGGFVLSLSAHANIPYVIDPRFPLFQQQLVRPKKSHEALANDIFKVPNLIETDAAPSPSKFTDETIDTIARSWVNFNVEYKNKQSSKFDKYSKRLHEEIAVDDASGPAYILAPYFMASGPDDDWWELSTKLFERTTQHLADKGTCIRVVASTMPHDLFSLIKAAGQDRVAVWVNALDERNSAPEMFAGYIASLASAQKKGVKTFALYGGFFGVICSMYGLGGSSHGIGYGEHREYLELPVSGPPPARYYVPMLHRYVTHEVAIKLWQADKKLVQCECDVCAKQSVVELEYHDLMKHSVLCRSQEISDWQGLTPKQAQKQLTSEKERFLKLLSTSKAPTLFKSEAAQCVSHIELWTAAIDIYEAFDELE